MLSEALTVLWLTRICGHEGGFAKSANDPGNWTNGLPDSTRHAFVPKTPTGGVFPTSNAPVETRARTLRKRMEARGVTFRLQTTVTRLEADPAGVRLEFDSAGMANRMTSSQVCAAVGRRFHPRSVGAARIGLEMGRLGLRTTAHLATSVPQNAPITSEQFLDGFTQFELVPTPVC